MKYYCKKCNFSTTNKYNLEKHRDTKKHLAICGPTFSEKTFTTKQAKHNHEEKNVCKKHDSDKLFKIIKDQSKQINKLINANKSSAEATSKTADVAKKSISMMKYANYWSTKVLVTKSQHAKPMKSMLKCYCINMKAKHYQDFLEK